MDLKRFVVYDTEVIWGPDKVDGGWSNPEAMQLASAVVYDYNTDRYLFFDGFRQKEELLDTLDNRIVVGFNSIRFDSRVILGNKRLVSGSEDYTNLYETSSYDHNCCFKNYDIMLEVVKTKFFLTDLGEIFNKLDDPKIHDGSFSLNGLSIGTIQAQKTGHGAKAPILFAERKISDLYEYNLQDVRLTKRLFEFILSHGFVLDKHGGLIPVIKPYHGNGIDNMATQIELFKKGG